MIRRKNAVLAVTVAAAAVALAACGGSSGSGGSTGGTTSATTSSSAAPAAGGGVLTNMLNIATEQPVSSLDPTTSTAYELNATVFDFLTELDKKGAVVPGLASSWTSNSTDSEWTFKLRPGLTFSDGSSLTSADVVFSYETIMKNPKSLNNGQVTNVASVTAPDASTVVFTMTKPDVAWPARAAQLGVVSQKAYTAEGPTKFATDPLGSGPYTVVSFDPGAAKIVLKANPKYWAGEPKARNVTVQQVSDTTTRLNGLQSGQFDLAILGGSQMATAKGAGLATYSEESTKNVYLGFNTNAAGVSSPLLREAMSYSIDRSAISKTLLSGLATPTGQLLPRSLNSYDPSITAPAQDLAKAKALVKQSGYSGQTISLEYSTGYVNSAPQVAQAIGNYLKQAGINVKLVTDDQNTFLANWFSKKIAGAYLFSIQSGSPDASSVLTLLDSTVATFTDPTMNSLLSQQGTETDPAARVKILQQITQLNMSKAYYVPLYTDSFNFAWNNKKISFTVAATGYLLPQYISGPA